MLKKLGSKLKEQKGFTLIELLAVIVILGIIAAIAVPAISGVINKSEIKAQAQEGVQIVNAAKMYIANENVPFTTADPSEILTRDQLMKYLDRVDAPSTDLFTVTVEKDATGVFTYTLKLHPINTTLAETDLTEQDLIEKAK
ncbi:type II secretion system protein [Bacillus sp. OK048]|uniref:type II secretion system protein n=1 Tax=Bacillus sp. OK048 TaxID=1882761 RepID=UPI00088F545A|nr:type II secretion system protein [Bacillus sp. OK048]SDM23544.1 type IV pilus assembly protein PilA [Bacillus sp. OK048]